MDIVTKILGSAFLLGVLWVFVLVHRENLRSKAISKAVMNLSEAELLNFVAELQAVGTTASKSYFLKRKQGETPQRTFHVCLPSEMDIEWLRDAKLEVALAAEPESDDDLGEVSIIRSDEFKSDFDLIAIPRIGFKNGGGANQYTSKVWFKRNPGLFRLANDIFPRDPDGFVSNLFSGSGRVNAPFEWLQSPPSLRCKSCSRKMLPVLQVYGSAIGLHQDSDYYISACPYEAGKFQIFLQSM